MRRGGNIGAEKFDAKVNVNEDNVVTDLAAMITDGEDCGTGSIQEIFENIDIDDNSATVREPMRAHNETKFYNLDYCGEYVLNYRTEFTSIGAWRPIRSRGTHYCIGWDNFVDPDVVPDNCTRISRP